MKLLGRGLRTKATQDVSEKSIVRHARFTLMQIDIEIMMNHCPVTKAQPFSSCSTNFIVWAFNVRTQYQFGIVTIQEQFREKPNTSTLMEKGPLDNLATKDKGKTTITAIKYSAPDRAILFSFYNHPQSLWVWADETSINPRTLNLHVDVGGRVKTSIKRKDKQFREGGGQIVSQTMEP